MKTNEVKTEKYVSVSESTLISLVSSKLKDRVLFPKKVETARKFLNNLHFEKK